MQKVVSALTFIPASDRDIWVKVGHAIKAEYGDIGFDIWDQWSRTDEESYKPSSAKAVWKSLRSTSVTIASLFYLARQNGWVDTDPDQKISPEEQQRRKDAAEKRQKEEQAKILRDNARAAKKALLLWRKAQPARPDHPYFVRKQVLPVLSLREIDVQDAFRVLGYHPKSDGEKLTGRLVVVPIKVGTELSSCEMIDESGRKAAIYGSARASGYWAAQPLPEDNPGEVIAIGEGVATVLSAKQATGCTVLAAMNHYNLQAVATMLRQRYAKAEIVVLGDLLKKNGEKDPVAIKASQSANVGVTFPRFDNWHSGLTDFNDLHVACGLQSVRQIITQCVSSNKPQVSTGV